MPATRIRRHRSVQGDERPSQAPTASSALGWSFLNTLASKLGTMLVGVVLARILGPAEFGTYAVAYIALAAVLSLNELGVSMAIVRWPTDPRLIAPTVTAVSLASSAVLTVAVYGVAPTFAAAMGDPSAAGVVRLLALAILLDGAVAVPAAVMQRHFLQRRKLVADQCNAWVGAGTALLLGLAGAGTWSLVIGRLVGSLVGGSLIVRFSPLPYRIGIDRRHLRKLLAFGLPLAGASAIVFAVGFVDQLTVGHVLGSTQLGYYVLAYNLASWPVILLSQPVRSVAPALLARLQPDRTAMSSALRQILGPLAAVALPTCLVIAVSADHLVGFVYGAAWAPAAAALRWLAVMAAFRILFELAYDYLVVLSRSRAILLTQCIWLAVLTPAVMWMAMHGGGIGGVGLTQSLVAGTVVLPVYLVLLRRAGVRIKGLAGALVVPLVVALLLAASAWGLTRSGLDDTLFLLVTGLVCAPVLALLLYATRHDIHAWRSLGEVASP